MDPNDAKVMAATSLTRDASLDELRQSDLRALSRDSAIADLVEAKIEQMLAGIEPIAPEPIPRDSARLKHSAMKAD